MGRPIVVVGLLGLQLVSSTGRVAEGSTATSIVVDAQAGDTLSVEAWKPGGTWILRVRGPSARENRSVAWRNPPVLDLSWKVLQAGRYTVECEGTTAGRAACEVEVADHLTAGDPTTRMDEEAALRTAYDQLEVWSPNTRRSAEELFKQTYAQSRTLGLANLQMDSLFGLASVQELAGEAAQSVTLLETAVALAQAAGDQRRFVMASARLGSSLAGLGHGDRATPYLEQARGVALETKFLLGTANAHMGMGEVHYLHSDLAEARREFVAALEAFEELGNAEGSIDAHLSIGYCFADLSQDQQARSRFERALEIARAAGDKRREATALRVLGNVHSKMSNEYEAIRYFEAAQALFEEAEDQVALVGLYNGLGEVHGRLNDIEVAIQYHQKAEKLAHSTGYRAGEGAALLEIADYQQRLGHRETARECYEKARSLFDSIGDEAMMASALAGLGKVAGAEGRFDSAIQNLKDALGILRTKGEARLSAGILNDLAETYLSMGQRADEARHAAEEALRLALEAADSLRQASALFLLAQVARQTDSLNEAKRYAEQSLAVGESFRSGVPSYELRALFFEELASRYSFYIDLLMDMHRSRLQSSFGRLAFEASERSRARALLDRLQERETRDDPLEGDLERERALREEIRTQALKQDLDGKGNDAGRAWLSEKLAELRRVQGLSRQGSGDSAEGGLSQPRGLEDIRATLAREGTLLLEYSLGTERSYVWAISKDRFAVYVLPPGKVLEDQARRIYGLLTTRQRAGDQAPGERRTRMEADDATFYAAGATLARTLLGPIEDLDSFERLIVVSDGVLNYVPFSALPHPRVSELGGDYVPLVLSHQIVRAPSLSALVSLHERSCQPGARDGTDRPRHPMRIAVLADPVFTRDDPRVRRQGRPRGDEANSIAPQSSLRQAGQTLAALPRLLASREEASSIASAAHGTAVTIATNFEANRATAERMLQSSYPVVHFATHGILNDDHPELSGIVTSLVDAEGRRQDGFLRTQDVYDLRVTSELVVLSACETAMGRLLRGEGITGLVHAFLHAGADTVVASKWRVDDVATQELMAEFYNRLLVEGADPASALRNAQIKLFRMKRTHAPFYWGGFEVHGLSASPVPSATAPGVHGGRE